MSVKLRLTRKGKRKQPFYRIVAVDSRAPRDGKYIEKVGHYNPLPDPAEVLINEERVFYWLNNGAQPSDTVKNILSKQGTLLKWSLMKKGLDQDKIEEEFKKWEVLQLERQKRLDALAAQEEREKKDETVAEEDKQAEPAEEQAAVTEKDEIKDEKTVAEKKEAEAEVKEETEKEDSESKDEAEAKKEESAAAEEKKPEEEAQPAKDAEKEEKKAAPEQDAADQAAEEETDDSDKKDSK